MADDIFASVADQVSVPSSPFSAVADKVETKAAPLTAAQQDERYGKIEAYTPSITERLDRATGGLFSMKAVPTDYTAPQRQPEYIPYEFSEIPHVVGGKLAEQLLNPGNVLLGVGGAVVPATGARILAGGFGGLMTYETLKSLPGLSGEIMNPKVGVPQKIIDSTMVALGATMAGLGIHGAIFPPEIQAKGPSISKILKGELINADQIASPMGEIRSGPDATSATGEMAAGKSGAVQSTAKAAPQTVVPSTQGKTVAVEKPSTDVAASKGPMITGVPGEVATPAAEVKTEASTVAEPKPAAVEKPLTVKRAKDFQETHNYDVTMPDGTTYQIFRDSEDGWWYRDGPGHYTTRNIGFNKTEAIEGIKKYHETVAQPPEVITQPVKSAPETPFAATPAPAPAESIQRGERFTDESGKTWEVWKNRQGTVEAHPVVDGKPVVNKESGQRWSVTPEARARNPQDRTDIKPVAQPPEVITQPVKSAPAAITEVAQPVATPETKLATAVVLARETERQPSVSGQPAPAADPYAFLQIADPVTGPPPPPGEIHKPGDGGFITSIKMKQVDSERVARGLEPIEPAIAKSQGASWDEAKAKIDANPNYPKQLLESVVDNPRPITDVEVSALLYERIMRKRDFEKAAMNVQAAELTGDGPAIAAARTEYSRAFDAMEEIDMATRRVGTEQGRALAAFKMQADQDYNLADLTLQRSADRGGKPLTTEDIKEVEETVKADEEAKANIDEHIKKRDEAQGEKAGSDFIEEIRTAKSEKTKSPEVDVEMTRQRIGNKVVAGDMDISRLVQKLARALVKSGVTEREALIDGVHGILREFIPDITRRQTMDAISGYGDFKPLSKDDVSVTLRDLKGQMQQIGKLEDMAAGEHPLKTGMERREPSDAERLLIREVNEAKKKLPPLATDPANQLKTSLQTQETRLTNEISDIERQLKNDEVFDPTKEALPTSPKIEALKKRLEELRYERKNARDRLQPKELPKTPEEIRLDQLDKQIEKISKQIDDGTPFTPERKPGEESPKISDKQKELDALKYERQNLRDRLQPKELPKTPEEIRLDQLDKQIEKISKQIDDETPFTPERKPGEESPKISDKQKELDALKYERQNLRDRLQPKPEPKTDLELVKDGLQRSIEYWQERIDSGEFGPRPKRIPTELDRDAVNLQLVRDKLRQEWQERSWELQQERRSQSETLGSMAVKWARNVKLLSARVYPKLLESGLIRVIADPLYRLSTQPLRVVPGLAERAPYEFGMSVQAEADAFTALLNSREAMWDKLTAGKTNIDIASGKGHRSSDLEMMNFIGNSHGMIKEPVRQAVYARSLRLRSEAAIRSGLNIQEPAVQMSIVSAAAADANRGILMGDNVISKFLNRVIIRSLENSNVVGTTALARTMEFLMPIVNIPTNIAIFQSRLTLGVPEAMLRLANAAKKGELKNGAVNLSEHEAKNISNAFSAGVGGTILAAYAWTHPEMFGGNFDAPKNNKGLKAGEIEILGTKLPGWLNHTPELYFLNTVASARRVYDRYYAHDTKAPGNAALEALLFTTAAPVKELPFIDTWLRLFDPNKSWGQKTGGMARDAIVPGALTYTMNAMDKNPRVPKTFLQELEMGIPGLHQTVPEKEMKLPPPVRRRTR